MAQLQHRNTITRNVMAINAGQAAIGMPFDARTDRLCGPCRAWDGAWIERRGHVRHSLGNSRTHSEVRATTSIDQVDDLLDIDLELKASFMGGLVEVGGLAQYHRDHRRDTSVCRVSIKYVCDTMTETAESELFTADGNVQAQDRAVLYGGEATHIVTGIEYGARALMSFELDHKEEESHESCQGMLQVVVRALAEGRGNLELNDERRSFMRRITIVTDAIGIATDGLVDDGRLGLGGADDNLNRMLRIYNNLGASIVEHRGIRGVPIKLTLTPIEDIVDSTARLYWQVNDRVLTDVARVYHAYAALEADVARLLNAERGHKALATFQRFRPDIGDALQQQVTAMYHSVTDNILKHIPKLRSSSHGQAAAVRLNGLVADLNGGDASPDRLRLVYDRLRSTLNTLDTDKRFHRTDEEVPQALLGLLQSSNNARDSVVRIADEPAFNAQLVGDASNKVLVYLHKDMPADPLSRDTRKAAVAKHNAALELRRGSDALLADAAAGAGAGAAAAAGAGAAAAAESPARLLMFGLSGAGKSSFCQFLTGSDVYTVGHSRASQTHQPMMARDMRWWGATGEHSRPIDVLDTPGADDTDGRDADMFAAVARSMRDAGSFDAMVYVLNSAEPRFTPAQRRLLTLFRGVFGPSMWSHVIIVATRWNWTTDAAEMDEPDGLSGMTRPQLTAQVPAWKGDLRSVEREVSGQEDCPAIDEIPVVAINMIRDVGRLRERGISVAQLMSDTAGPRGAGADAADGLARTQRAMRETISQLHMFRGHVTRLRLVNAAPLIVGGVGDRLQWNNPTINEFDDRTQRLVVGTTIKHMVPRVTGHVDSWRCEGDLPPGLRFDDETGWIRGTPERAADDGCTVRVTATNLAGDSNVFVVDLGRVRPDDVPDNGGHVERGRAIVRAVREFREVEGSHVTVIAVDNDSLPRISTNLGLRVTQPSLVWIRDGRAANTAAEIVHLPRLLSATPVGFGNHSDLKLDWAWDACSAIPVHRCELMHATPAGLRIGAREGDGAWHNRFALNEEVRASARAIVDGWGSLDTPSTVRSPGATINVASPGSLAVSWKTGGRKLQATAQVPAVTVRPEGLGHAGVRALQWEIYAEGPRGRGAIVHTISTCRERDGPASITIEESKSIDDTKDYWVRCRAQIGTAGWHGPFCDFKRLRKHHSPARAAAPAPVAPPRPAHPSFPGGALTRFPAEGAFDFITKGFQTGHVTHVGSLDVGAVNVRRATNGIAPDGGHACGWDGLRRAFTKPEGSRGLFIVNHTTVLTVTGITKPEHGSQGTVAQFSVGGADGHNALFFSLRTGGHPVVVIGGTWGYNHTVARRAGKSYAAWGPPLTPGRRAYFKATILFKTSHVGVFFEFADL